MDCINTSTSLAGSSSTAGATYSWAGPGIVSGGTTLAPTVNQAGTFTLTVTNPTNGCMSSATTSVSNLASIPNVSISAPSQLTCIVNSVVLSGSSSTAGATFAWAGPGIVSGGTSTSPTVNTAGSYTLTVTNPTNGCTSSASIIVVLNNTPPNLTINAPQTINCNYTSVSINSSSSTPNVSYSWTGPSIVSGANTNSPVVNAGGLYNLTLTNNTNGCTAIGAANIAVDNVIPTINFTIDSLIGCEGLNVNFNETSGQLGMNYSWIFGDGTTSNLGPATSHYYSQTGCFTPSLIVTNPTNGCSNSLIYSGQICILETPDASIYASQTELSSISTTVQFTNNSINATDFIWNFGDGSSNPTTINAAHTYDDADGIYNVTLIASNQGMCFDTATIQITVEEVVVFYVPNTFTPDGDSYNQTFQPIITSGIDVQNFTFLIYNRWGELIWESHDASVGWDGKYGGIEVQDGTYIWTLQFKDKTVDKRYTYEGHVNLIR